jgi:hypothetical protein
MAEIAVFHEVSVAIGPGQGIQGTAGFDFESGGALFTDL